MLIPDTSKGKRQEAEAMRESAMRLLQDAEELEFLADLQDRDLRAPGRVGREARSQGFLK